MIVHWCSKCGRQKGNWQSWFPDSTAAGIGHLRGTATLGGFGDVYVIFQAAWKLGRLAINDQMQIVPSGHSLFSQNFTALHTRTSWRESVNNLVGRAWAPDCHQHYNRSGIQHYSVMNDLFHLNKTKQPWKFFCSWTPLLVDVYYYYELDFTLLPQRNRKKEKTDSA
jgi:hypothetical protein